jgi:WD40 repeat protein
VLIHSLQADRDAVLLPTRGRITDVAFSGDGRFLVAASGEDSTLWMWDAAGFELRATHPVDRLLTSVAGNGNGGLVAAGDRHGQVLLWRPGEGVETPGPGRHLSAVSDLLFTPDEALLISASGTIRLWPLVVATAVSAETRPNSFALHPNHPNPFNAATMIRFRLAQSGPVRLEVYNLLGQRVRTLIDREYVAGPHDVIWDGGDDDGIALATGVYLYRLVVRDRQATRKLLLVR